jgi:hypothetical protein
MRFKAKIIECRRESKFKEIGKAPKYNIFKFSRGKIWFTKNQPEESYFLSPYAVCEFRNGADYTFDKVRDKNDKTQFRIDIKAGKSCQSFIELSFINKIKCNIIHCRYWVQKPENRDKIYVGIIVGIVLTVAGVFLKKCTN